MPRNKKYGTKGARRKVGRSSYSSRSKVPRKGGKRQRMARPSKSIIRQPSGTADSLYVKLRYVDVYGWTITSGVGIDQVFRGNSLFDADFTGTGGQPYFYDQWSALYNAYTVLGSSCKAVAFTASGATAPFSLYICPALASASFIGANDLSAEQPYAKTRDMQVNQATRPIKSYMSTAKISGIHRSQVFDDPAYSAAITANPASPWFWHVGGNSTDMSSNQSLTVKVYLTFYVRFFQRARPTLS